jgi:hypothetical protein
MVVLGAPTETLTWRLGHNSTTQLEAANKKTMKLLHGGSFEVTSFAQGKIHGGWMGENQITWIGL